MVKPVCFLPTSSPKKTKKEASVEHYGGKGAHLIDMAAMGVPVPPGVVLPTYHSTVYLKASEEHREEFLEAVMMDEVIPNIRKIKNYFGYLPLLSVRSGARVSMPGMMDTILNVGLTKENLPEWCERIGERAAHDCYRRLLEMYGTTVYEIDPKAFTNIKHDHCEAQGVKDEYSFTTGQLKELITLYELYVMIGSFEMPTDVATQIAECISAVWGSWDSDRAIEYRRIHGYPDDWGTAVTIQSMVFGNMNEKSCSGVLFTRHPSTGINEITGEFLINAQGEDVVAGTATPQSIEADDPGGLCYWDDDVYHNLMHYAVVLESKYKDMQDIEFTVQDGKLYILQTRSGKRGAEAAIRIAWDLYSEDLLTLEEALGRITLKQYKASKRASIAPDFHIKPSGTGIPASQGIVSGVAVFSSQDAVNCTEPCILIANETTPEDISGMNAAVGILTKTGGATSHAAVVARGMEKTCVVGCTDMLLKVSDKYAELGGDGITAGDKVTIDGATGRVWFGADVPVVPGKDSVEARFLSRLTQDSETYYLYTGGAEGLYGANLYVVPALLPDGLTQEHLEIIGKEAKNILFDLTPLSLLFAPEDEALIAAFGPPDTVDDSQNSLFTDEICGALVKGRKALEPLDRVRVRIVEKGYTKIAAFESYGFSLIGETNDLETFLSGGSLVASDALKTKIGAGAYEKIVELMATAGVELSSESLVDPVNIETLAYEIFSNYG